MIIMTRPHLRSWDQVGSLVNEAAVLRVVAAVAAARVAALQTQVRLEIREVSVQSTINARKVSDHGVRTA